MVQLINRHGSLYYPGDPKRDFCAVNPGDPVPVLVVYPEGDCDGISWPFGTSTVCPSLLPTPERVARDRDNLRRALFDDRERGLIEDEEVLLPDGTSAW